MDVEVPVFAVEAEQIADGVIMLTLVITTSGTMAKYFLCTQDQNYQDIAKQLHDKINQAGREARRAASGLVLVPGLPDSLKNGGPHVRNARPRT